MELLSYIGSLSMRRSSLVERAEALKDEHKTLDKMETEMAQRTEALVYRLREDKINFNEFKRIAADETITAALAGFMLGNKTRKIDDVQFAKGSQAIAYLWKFFEGIEQARNTGRLDNENYEEYDPYEILEILEAYEGPLDDEAIQDILDNIPTSDLGTGNPGKSIPASWEGVESRLSRYMVTPMYGAMVAGEMLAALTGGSKMMRRVSRHDKRVCEDCIMYDAAGWVPIGALPPPGERCRCHDRCRCQVIYQ